MEKQDTSTKEMLFTGPHQIRLKRWISSAPFEKLLGINITAAENGTAVLTMPFVESLAQGGGLMHGGAIVTLADTAVAMAIKSKLPPDSRFGTISINAEFLKPVIKGTLTARAETRFLKNRQVKGTSVVHDEEENRIMAFTAMFKLARDVDIPV